MDRRNWKDLENENALHIKLNNERKKAVSLWHRTKSSMTYEKIDESMSTHVKKIRWFVKESVTPFSPREQLSLIHEKKCHKSIRTHQAKRSDESTKKKWLDKRPVKSKEKSTLIHKGKWIRRHWFRREKPVELSEVHSLQQAQKFCRFTKKKKCRINVA